MMGMLTFVVILLAFGTLVQRFDGVQRLLGIGVDPIELKTDQAMARPNEIAAIDVLANDAGVVPDDADRLTIVRRPACGRAFVRDGRVNYLGEARCAGTQRFAYGLAGEDAAGEVRLSVAAASPSQEPVAEEGRAAAAPPEPAPPSPAVELAPPPATLAAPAAEGGAAPAPEIARTGAGGTPASPRPGSRAGGREAGTTALARAEPGAGTPAADGSGARGATPEGPTADPAAEAAREGAAPDPAPPEPGADCTVPPALVVEAGPGAMTEVIVDSPCHAGAVAELVYDGLRFAIPLDVRGAGSLAVPGFQRTSQAELSIRPRNAAEAVAEDSIAFEIAFRDIERVERVAVVWEEPADLALHALEFGAATGSAGHVRPGQPRSLGEVRPEGGGWLESYAAAGDAGQRIDVYSYWRRYGGPSGVVKLGLAPGEAPCGEPGTEVTGADYRVLRATGGRPERVRLGRVAPLDCTVLAGRAGPMIGDAVDDLILRRR